MGINPNQINIVDNTGSSAVEGSVILSKNTGDHVWSSNNTGSIKIPSGTTAQRNGAPIDGYLRFNTDNKSVELYSATAPIGWKSVGQLNIAGTAANPGITFSNNQSTGFFQPNLNQIGLSVGGAQRVLWTATDQTISTNVTIVGTLTVSAINISGSNASLNPLLTETLAMNDGATNAPVGGSLTYNASSCAGMIVDYVLKRGIHYRIGTLAIASNTAAVSLNERATASTADIGVTFGINLSGSNVVVNYTSTSIGQSIVGKFSIRKWDSY